MNTKIETVKSRTTVRSEPLPWKDGNIDAWMTHAEADALLKLTEEKEIYIEVGVYQGFSLKTVAPNVKQIYAIDRSIYPTTSTILQQNPHIKFLCGQSHDMFVHIPDLIADVLLIDCDHSFQMVQSDFNDYYPKVKKGGIIAFHDYEAHEGVTLFVDSILNKFPIIGRADSLVWIKK